MTVTHVETPPLTNDAVRLFADLARDDVDYAGGKGANLGELTSAGLPVPDGFVVGAPAYAAFCAQTGLREKLTDLLGVVNVEDTAALQAASVAARELFDHTPIPQALAAQIRTTYEQLADEDPHTPVAVRSSATAEDTAATSFAGMNETFLNIRGADAVIDAVRRCWRSLFGARTIYYRGVNGFAQADMDIAVVVQRQVNSTRAGVMFTVNPATGQRDELVIEGSFGLGEAVVEARSRPTATSWKRPRWRSAAARFTTRTWSSSTAPMAARASARSRRRRRCALCSVMRRSSRSPSSAGASSSTTTSRRTPSGRSTPTACCGCCRAARSQPSMMRHPQRLRRRLSQGPRPCCCTGWAGRQAVPAGRRGCSPRSRTPASLNDGDVLVTHMTSPDWLPLLRRAGAIVTDSGGMTCHAAIVSRELGIPCVVGTGEATGKLRDGEIVTVDATRGVVLEGARQDAVVGEPAPSGSGERSASASPGAASEAAAVTATQILVNLSEPSQVARVKDLAVDGVGLLRAELMVLEALAGDHPRTLLEENRGEEL